MLLEHVLWDPLAIWYFRSIDINHKKISLHQTSYFELFRWIFFLLHPLIDHNRSIFAIVTPRSYRSITGHHKYILMIIVSYALSLLIPIGVLISEQSIGDQSIVCTNVLQTLSTSFSKYAILGHVLIGASSVLIYVILTVNFTSSYWNTGWFYRLFLDFHSLQTTDDDTL